VSLATASLLTGDRDDRRATTYNIYILKVSDNEFEKKSSMTYLEEAKKQQSLLTFLAMAFRIVGNNIDAGIDAFYAR
jgi:hypothetical protein